MIQKRHWDGGESVRAIERSLNIGKTVLSSWCKRHAIRIRSKAAQIAISHHLIRRRTGAAHHNFGKTKEEIPWLAKRAKELSVSNPSHDPAIKRRMAISRSDTYRSIPTHDEAIALGLIASGGVDFVFQFPLDAYVADFAFPGYLVIVEIDGENHSSFGRKAHDLVRDKSIVDQGWTIIRVPARHLATTGHWLSVVKDHVPDFQIPGGLPRGRSTTKNHYRVIVRDREHPAGRKL